jgi:hypothetical protein
MSDIDPDGIRHVSSDVWCPACCNVNHCNVDTAQCTSGEVQNTCHSSSTSFRQMAPMALLRAKYIKQMKVVSNFYEECCDLLIAS